MRSVIDFVVRPRIGRRLYWISLPILGLIGAGGLALLQSPSLRAPGIAAMVVAAALILWTVGRRMKDTTSAWILWLVCISVGGRLAEAGVRMAGGSHDQQESALGLVIVLVLLALGLIPTERPPAPPADETWEEEDEGAEAAH